MVDAAGLSIFCARLARRPIPINGRAAGDGQAPERTPGVIDGAGPGAVPATVTREMAPCNSGANDNTLAHNKGRTGVVLVRPALLLTRRTGIHPIPTGVTALPDVMVTRGGTNLRERTAEMGNVLHVARPSAERFPTALSVPTSIQSFQRRRVVCPATVAPCVVPGAIGSTVLRFTAPRSGFESARRAVIGMGRAQSVWAVALADQRRHHRVLVRVLDQVRLTPEQRRDEREAREQAEASAIQAKTRGDVINLLTGNVQDLENIERKCRAAKVPINLFDFPPIEAA